MRDTEIGSSAEVGSSSSTTSGFTAMVRAMHRRCCWPPESPSAEECSRSLTSFQMAALVSDHSTRSSIAARPIFSCRRTPKAMLS